MFATRRGLIIGLSLAALVFGVSAQSASAQARVQFRSRVIVSAHQLGPGPNVIIRANPLQPLVRGTVGPMVGTNVLAPSGPGNPRLFYNNPYGYYNNNPRLSGGLNTLYGGGTYGTTGGLYNLAGGYNAYGAGPFTGYYGASALPYGGFFPGVPPGYAYPPLYGGFPAPYVYPGVITGVPPGYYSPF
jgi:hypothetical protein